MDPSLLDNVLILNSFFEFVYHIGSYFNMHSIIASGLIVRRKNYGRYRQTVLFTAVDLIDKNPVDQEEQRDRTKPRHTAYKHSWTISQDAIFWVDICRAQKMGLKFFQIRSNAIILHDTLPPICIERVVFRRNHEILKTRISKSPVLLRRLPSKLIGENIEILMRQRAVAAPNQFAGTEQPVFFFLKACWESCSDMRPAGRKTRVGPVLTSYPRSSTTEWSESATCASRVEVPNPTGDDGT